MRVHATPLLQGVFHSPLIPGARRPTQSLKAKQSVKEMDSSSRSLLRKCVRRVDSELVSLAWGRFFMTTKDGIRMIRSLCFLIVLFVFLTPTPACSQVEFEDARKHLAGVFQAHRGNIESIRTGDVIIKSSLLGTGEIMGVKPGPDSSSLVSETNGFVRVIFDFDKKRFLVVNRREQTIDLFDALGDPLAETQRGASDSSGLFDSTKSIVLVKQKAGKAADRSNVVANENQFLGILDVPNFFGLGCSLDCLGGWNSIDSVYQSLDQFGHQDAIVTVENVGNDRYRALSSLVLEGSAAGGVRVETDWDVKRQVPLKFVHYPGPKADPQRPENLKPYHTISANWKLHDGYLVPTFGRGSYKRPLAVSDLEFLVEYEMEMQLHWFSVNEAIPDEQFDSGIFDDLPRLSKLIDKSKFEQKDQSAEK
jgi:hypothetical protein